MKTNVLILFILGVFLYSCGKEKEKIELIVKNVSKTDCKQKEQKAYDLDFAESLELREENNYLKVKHINAMHSCCIDEIPIISKISNDTIFIDEQAKDGGCDCICNYDLNYEIGTLNYQKYHIILNTFFKFDLDFILNTDTVINIKNMNDD